MKRVVQLIFVAVLVSMVIMSCAKEKGPEASAIAFMEAVSSMDFEKAAEYATPETQEMLGFLGMMSAEMSEEELQEVTGTKFTHVNTEMREGTAFVTLSADGQEQTLTLEEVDGTWLVALDKEDLDKEL